MSFTTGGHNPNGDKEINPPPEDGISQLVWSPTASILAGSSWDNKIRLWEIDNQGNSRGKVAFSHEAPALCVCFNGDGTKIFSGGCDKKAMLWDLNSNNHQQIAAHDGPISFVHCIQDQNILMTGSWDTTIRYWDSRQQTPALIAKLADKLYAADVVGQLVLVATGNRKIQIFDLNKPNQPFSTIESPLKYQTRAIKAFPDMQNFAISSIEGRVAIQNVKNPNAASNFTFKCHRSKKEPGKKQEIYSVNDLAVSHYGTFATMGSDGGLHFWDKNKKNRLHAFKNCNLPITCGTFNKNATIFAYAVCYDWSKGAQGYNQAQMKSHILLHGVEEKEIKPLQTISAINTRHKT